jgi:hypothetical protein
VAAGLRATASFGNRNHYAAAWKCCCSAALGCSEPHGPGLEPAAQTAWGVDAEGYSLSEESQLYIAGLGSVTSLGLLFSLSRSGISCALVGCAALVLLAVLLQRRGSRVIDLDESGTSRSRGEAGRLSGRRLGHVYLALASPLSPPRSGSGFRSVASRFELLSEENGEAEKGRSQVWWTACRRLRTSG